MKTLKNKNLILLFSSYKRLGSCDKFRLKGDGHLLGEGFFSMNCSYILAKFSNRKANYVNGKPTLLPFIC